MAQGLDKVQIAGRGVRRDCCRERAAYRRHLGASQPRGPANSPHCDRHPRGPLDRHIQRWFLHCRGCCSGHAPTHASKTVVTRRRSRAKRRGLRASQRRAHPATSNAACRLPHGPRLPSRAGLREPARTPQCAGFPMPGDGRPCCPSWTGVDSSTYRRLAAASAPSANRPAA